jgi:type II secretory pathway component PulM
MAVSVIIFAVVYFTVIKPDSNTANQAVKSSLQQSQQVINQAKKTLNNTSAKAGSGADKQASQALDKASKLTACVSAAGTDPTKLSACQTKFGG